MLEIEQEGPCGLVPREQTLERIRLVAMDMDSTLITIECVDEIADALDIKPQVSAITASAMRGDFLAGPLSAADFAFYPMVAFLRRAG